MFGFGKKKEQTSSSTQQQQSAAPPPPQPTAAATTSDGDMFGGMQTRSRRKKGTEPEPAPEVKAPEPEPPKPEEPKPFFSSFNFANAAGTAVDMSAYQDDPETARVKRRLERFYELYNPSKLSSLDETVKRFAGREAELFEALEKKYGPEPKEPAAATVDKQATNKSGTKPPSRSKASADEGFGVAPASDAGFGTGTADSFGTGSGFGDTTTSGGAGTGFGDGFGGGFGDDQGFGTGGDKGGGFGATGFGVTTGFGAGGGFETADGGGFGTVTGGEGFGFGADAATGAGFGFTSEASAFGGGFGDDQGAASSAFGFTTQPEPKTQVEPSSPPDVFGAAIVTPTTAFAPAVNTQQAEDSDSDSSSDGGRYGELERQNEIIESARRQVANARLAGAEALAVEGEKRRLRRSYVESYAKLEGELERLTNAEEYEAADLVNTKLVEVAKAIDQLDSQRSEDLQRVVMRDVVTALETLSSQYSAQRTLLQETKAEEERRTMNYIAESRTKLEQVADVVRGDLDKATRLLKNTEQEVDNLAQRRKKIEDKIAEQTKELRAERDKVSTQATKLEDEIKELEKTLAAKKRMLTERKVALQDMDHQLNLVTDAHRESMSSITSQEAEEATRLAEAQRRVAALTQAREANERATAELQEETEGMMQSLEEHATKIRRFDQNSTVINTTLISNFKEFFTKAIGEVLRARAEPDAVCLNAAPHRADTSGGSQVAALQSKLSSIENEIKATLEAESKAAAQAQELANLLPTLETAKKAAAAAKQFKEAAAKTEEIKRATEDRTAALAKADELRVKAGALEENARQVRKEKKDAAAAYRARIRTFTDRYAQLLRNALVTIDVASSASVAGLQYIDALPLLEASALAAHIHEAHDEVDSSDALIDAARKYIMSLFEELSGIIDVPVQTLLVDPDADKQSERLSSRQQSHSPTADHGDAAFAPPADDVQPEDGDQTKEGGGADGFGFTATTDEGFGTGFEADGNAGGFGFAAATAADPYAAFTVDELRDQLRDKTAAMEAAAAAEDYMLCDELQSTITALETAIAEREAFA